MLSLLLILALSPSQSAEVNDIVVVGQRLPPLVSVTIEGDVPATTLVRSSPEGIRCGAARFKYEYYGAPRICWMRRPAGEMIRLRVENDAGFSVRWEGCEPTDDDQGCAVISASDAGNVKVSFTPR
jgi:hypothetical protein